MLDIPAIKARLSDPREVARLLGLRVMGPQRRGVMVACPIHGNRSGSMSLRNDDGKVRAHCFGCGFHGDIIDLLGAIESDPRRGLARAAELAGGAVPMARVEVVQDERLSEEVYHELAEQILEAGRLDGRAWVREVEAYLAERRLLELARADGWACLPGLKWLLQIAEEVCGVYPNASKRTGQAARRDNANGNRAKDDAFVLVRTLLIRAKLAQYNKRGEFVPTWGRWRLVIPWRGPDGRISALQRRRTWKHVPRDDNDPEPAKYVLPWLPDWPYGSERIGGAYGMSAGDFAIDQISSITTGLRDAHKESESQVFQSRKAELCAMALESSGVSSRDAAYRLEKVAIVEGAVDTLAMRALHPGFVVVGIPGINNWRSSWAEFVAATCKQNLTVRYALDRGKPDPHGIVPEDRACARIALDCAGMGQERDGVLEWLISRHRRGKTLFCVLCGAPEPWLCRGCGRRRAPVGMDWGEVWRGQAMP